MKDYLIFSFVFACVYLTAFGSNEKGISAWRTTDISWNGSHTTKGLPDFREIFDLLNNKTIPDLEILFPKTKDEKIYDRNIYDRNIYDRKIYDNVREKDVDKSNVIYTIVICVVVLLGFVVYAFYYFSKTERTTIQNIGPPHNIIEFRNTATNSNSRSNGADQPPLYDEIVLHLPTEHGEFPQVKPAELETPPPRYNDATMKR